MYKGELDMGVTKMTKIAKKYMNYCAKCGNLSYRDNIVKSAAVRK